MAARAPSLTEGVEKILSWFDTQVQVFSRSPCLVEERYAIFSHPQGNEGF
jgi:hypothetical protein